jgi:hypothetical protein
LWLAQFDKVVVFAVVVAVHPLDLGLIKDKRRFQQNEPAKSLVDKRRFWQSGPASQQVRR